MANNTAITGWIRPQEASDFIYTAIKRGEYAKGEIKKSSCKFANGKDKTDGYLCKVIVIGNAQKREVVDDASDKDEIKRDADGLLIPKKTAKPSTALTAEWVEMIDSYDVFDLEEELRNVLAEGEKATSTVNIINLLNKRNYIKARIADLESVMDPSTVQRIHELDQIAGI